MSHPDNHRPLRVTYFDGAVAYGGSLQVLSMLISALDREAITPSLIACTPREQLKGKFDDEAVALLLKIPLSYAVRERWMSRFDSHHKLIRKLCAYTYSAAQLLAGMPNQFRLFKHLRKARPDVLHVNNSYVPLFVAHLLRIPVIWHIHGVPYRPSLLERNLLKKIHRFIAISRYIADSAVAAGFPASKMEVILNPSPEFLGDAFAVRDNLRKSYGIPPDHKVIAHVGRLVPWKGQLEFLRAFKLLLNRNPKTTALIVGDDGENIGTDYRKLLDQFAQTEGLAQNIIFTGHVGKSQQLMAGADLVVHSSIAPEPFGLVIIEAMLAETPVVASPLGAPAELIDHGRTGFLALPHQTAELATAMEAALAAPTAEIIARNAIVHGRAAFSIRSFACKVRQIYMGTKSSQRLTSGCH